MSKSRIPSSRTHTPHCLNPSERGEDHSLRKPDRSYFLYIYIYTYISLPGPCACLSFSLVPLPQKQQQAAAPFSSPPRHPARICGSSFLWSSFASIARHEEMSRARDCGFFTGGARTLRKTGYSALDIYRRASCDARLDFWEVWTKEK